MSPPPNLSDLSDHEVAAWARQGHEAAHRELLRRYQPRVYQFFCHMVHDHELAKDLTQETFFKVFNALESARRESKFSAWVFRIANNTGIDHLRRKQIDTLPLENPPQSLAKVQDMAKSVIRYAENQTRGDDGKLQLLGWGGRRARTLTVMEPPGQVRTLEVLREGKDWVFLDWKEPLEGGEVAAYRVQRRQRPSGDWVDVGMSVESEVTLNGQDAGVEYEYRVIAVNKAGEGPASNIARAVL